MLKRRILLKSNYLDLESITDISELIDKEDDNISEIELVTLKVLANIKFHPYIIKMISTC